MKKIIILLVLVFFASTSMATASLNQQLQHLTNYHATFKQKTYANGRLTAQASGEVWIRKPWYMRWQVDKPNYEILLVNGKTLYNISPDLNQATVRQMNATELSNAGLLLASKTDLAKSFVIKSLSDKDGKAVYQLTPKKALQITKIILMFKKNQLVSMQTWNSLGQSNIFEFDNINEYPINKILFNFKPAKGMDVLKAG